MHHLERIPRQKSGFTLIELLLAIAIITLASGFSVSIYQSFQLKNDLDLASINIAQSLRRAQILARGSASDSSWGVKIQSGSIIIFKGDAFASRDNSFDEVLDISPAITPSGDTELVFGKMSGEPVAAGIILISNANGDVKNIILNQKGTVSY